MPAARRTAPGLCLLALLSMSGCSIARTVGGEFAAGAVSRLQAEDSAIIALQRQLADTAFAIVAREFRGAVLDPATETWSDMRAIARAEADTLGGVLDTSLERSLQLTLPAGLNASGAVLDQQMRVVAESFAREFTAGLGRGMQAAIGPALDTLARVVVRSTSSGIEDDLRPVLHRLMLEVRDSLEARIGDVDQAVSTSRTVSGLRSALYGAGVTLLAILTVMAVTGWRRRARALEALFDAIEAGDHEPTKEAAATCAREAGVDGWLNQRLKDRWRLVTGDRGQR